MVAEAEPIVGNVRLVGAPGVQSARSRSLRRQALHLGAWWHCPQSRAALHVPQARTLTRRPKGVFLHFWNRRLCLVVDSRASTGLTFAAVVGFCQETLWGGSSGPI